MVDFSARENTGNTRLFLKDGEENFFERPGGWCFNASFSHQYWQHMQQLGKKREWGEGKTHKIKPDFCLLPMRLIFFLPTWF